MNQARLVLGANNLTGVEVISIVVCFYNNEREAKNTLFSLSRQYQMNAEEIDYEVIVIDHGSKVPLPEDVVCSFGSQFTYKHVANAPASPVRAINAACREAKGDKLMVLIDGAHIVSPGVLKLTADAFTFFQSPFIATVPFHLGPKSQNASVTEGYSQSVEDELLRKSGWRDDGYNLYKITGSFSDGGGGWFGSLFETSCFAIGKADFLSLGGFDDRFQSRGGGLVSLDFFKRASSRNDLQYVMLLGEGTFHQFHGGVASNAPSHKHPWKEFHDEYRKITGADFDRSHRKPYYIGELHLQALNALQASAGISSKMWQAITAPGWNAAR